MATAVLLAVTANTRPGDAAERSPGPRVALQVNGCSAAFTSAVRRIVDIELGELLIASDASTEVGHRVALRCDGNVGWIEAEVSDGDRRADRTIVLGDFPGDAAPRALALAAIETLATLSPAVRLRLGAREASARVPEAPPGAGAPDPIPSTGIGVSAGLRSFGAPNGLVAWGARADVDRRLGGRWRLAFDLDGAAAAKDVPLGKTSGLLFSIGTSIGVHVGDSGVAGVLALGARAGIARLAGDAGAMSSVVADSVVRPWAGPTLSGRVVVGRRWTLTGSIETGYAAIGTEGLAGGTTALAASGFWLAIFAGGGIRR